MAHMHFYWEQINFHFSDTPCKAFSSWRKKEAFKSNVKALLGKRGLKVIGEDEVGGDVGVQGLKLKVNSHRAKFNSAGRSKC